MAIPTILHHIGQDVGQGHQNVVSYTVVVLITYLLLVSFLRKQRLRSTLQHSPYKIRMSYSSMTLEDASQIQNMLYQLEFPFTFHKGLQFALFRTYGEYFSVFISFSEATLAPLVACNLIG